ncbi:hypothetical protein [Candidatus Binatus soli]|jgi:hypothetical protein|uniref:hypothetical protein n=1 Tax=Candidatus Binatus soli TaxID=1953413 RepID=UPI003D0A1495
MERRVVLLGCVIALAIVGCSTNSPAPIQTVADLIPTKNNLTARCHAPTPDQAACLTLKVFDAPTKSDLAARCNASTRNPLACATEDAVEAACGDVASGNPVDATIVPLVAGAMYGPAGSEGGKIGTALLNDGVKIWCTNNGYSIPASAVPTATASPAA